MELVDFSWNKEWALHKNAAYDQIIAKEMHNRLKEFTDNSKLEQNEVLKALMI
ncbi:1621_t:CDS:2 [Cetraspora pellucida]|uniref:1621_t:CDS:1 n=1 Tax=Cetraspora pellucida TaxID=1433469 RepID=A0A9N9GRE9_9GLOM|nr:1621_t:CDS:2 [Cetraspora pellucida]